MRLVFVVCLFWLAPAFAADSKVVMVLYFENNTNQREFDVLQKGLADMLITDLSEVEGLKVVERERLRDLLAELKLQRTNYFNPATATRVGKGVGAQYAITGSMVAFAPQLRIDVRLINIATGDVEKSEQVVGRPENFLELEQELVTKFLARLGLKRANPVAEEASLASALAYSRGLDFIDQKDFRAASTQLAAVAKDAPDFALARERYATSLKRLREASRQREVVLGVDEATLRSNIAAVFARTRKLPESDQRDLNFCYRALNGNFLLWQIARTAKTPHAAGAPQLLDAAGTKRATALMESFFANWEQAASDAAGPSMPYSYSCELAAPEVREAYFADYWRLAALGGSRPGHTPGSPVEIAADLAEFTFHGRAQLDILDAPGNVVPFTYQFLPTLQVIDAAYGKRVLAMLDRAEAGIDRTSKMFPGVEHFDTRIAVARSGAWVALNEPQRAIAALQTLLERYPKHARYLEFEKRIEALIGVSTEALATQKALRTCDVATLFDTIVPEVERVAESQGPRGVEKLLVQLAACEGEFAKVVLRKARSASAEQAARAGDCVLGKALTAIERTPWRTVCE